MSYRIIFTPEAADQLAALYHYIAEAASPEIAAQYTEAIVSHCETLHMFSHRGTMKCQIMQCPKTVSKVVPRQK